MKGKIIIPIKVDRKKIPNKMHLDAQIRFPHLVMESKKDYKRAREKSQLRKELLNY